MKFKDLLKEKNTTGYALAKNTGIPYTTINDLINGRTVIQNVSLKHALVIADFLKVNINILAKLDKEEMVEFRYFRNNVLNDLKNEKDPIAFIDKIISKKEIDYYYKNNGLAYALYLVALLDYLCRVSNIPIYDKRYNELRSKTLNEPFFVGSNLIKFDSMEEAERELGIKVIPEFRKHNIIEEDIFNVA